MWKRCEGADFTAKLGSHGGLEELALELFGVQAYRELMEVQSVASSRM
jgi:hypothetical protein